VPLAERLKDLGLDVFEYSHNMGAGDLIAAGVQDQIATARLVLLCLSDAALAHSRGHGDWLATEAAWSVARFRNGTDGLMLLKVAALDRGQFPAVLRERNVLDVAPSSSFESKLHTLVLDARRKLGIALPRIVKACVVAMTAAECADSLAANGLPAEVTALCCARTGDSSATKDLVQRYGAKRSDFAPFRKSESCVAAVQRVLREFNRRRSSPVHVRWFEDEFLAPEGSDGDRRVRNEWRDGDSLLIVDGASLHHPSVKTFLDRIPPPNDRHRAALVCVPPHTHSLGALDACVRFMAKQEGRLGDCFDDWLGGKHLESGRALAFDTALEPGFLDWMYRALMDRERGANPSTLRLLGGNGLRDYLEPSS
jgi:hypothetical protein